MNDLSKELKVLLEQSFKELFGDQAPAMIELLNNDIDHYLHWQEFMPKSCKCGLSTLDNYFDELKVVSNG